MGDRYNPLYELGAGAFGRAWVVRDNRTQMKCVSKVIQIKGLSSRALDRCVTEVAVLSACSHLNIVRYIEAFVSGGALHIVMEYASGGDLQQKIEKQNGVLFTNDMVLEWFLQVILALEYIHSKNILHRDLKPQNIFLTDSGIVKLGDFGIARVLNNCDDLASTRIGTPFYISPEICERKPYNSSSDMWAAGCLLYQMCTLQVPFRANNFDDLTKKIIKAEYDPISSHFNEVIELILSKLLVTTPNNRLSATQLLSLEPLQGMVLFLKNRNYQKGRISRPRSNSLVTDRSRSHLHQKARSTSVSRVQRDVVTGNNGTLETQYQVKGRNETDKRSDTDKVEISCKSVVKNRTESAERNSCCKNMVRTEQQNKEEDGRTVKITNFKDTNGIGIKANFEVQSCRGNPLGDKSHVAGVINDESNRRNVMLEESKLKTDKKNKAINTRTFTIKDSVARRLSEASPKLAQTVRKQRFSVSISEPFVLNKMKNGNEGKHGNHEDLVDDVFQSPDVFCKQRIDSKTYLVKEKADSDANNNSVSLGYNIVEKEQRHDYVNTAMVRALSVSEFDKGLMKEILYDEIRLKVGNKQSDHLISKVRQLILEDGQSYQCLRHKLIEEELYLIPLICMYISVCGSD